MTAPDAKPWLAADVPGSVSRTLDESGLLCPLPIVHLAQALKQAAAGDILHIISTDRGFFPDLIRWLRVRPHDLVALREEAEAERNVKRYVAWVRCGD